MDAETVISLENLTKVYRLGQINTGTLAGDFSRLFARLRGRPDPTSKVTQATASAHELWALEDVSLKISRGSAVGILGRNGAGKSTLVKILSRITAPSSGRARIRGRVSSLLEVGTGFHPELTGRENIFLNGCIMGLNKSEIRRKFDPIVEFSGVERFIDTPVKRYSSGMYVRLAFAVAAHLEPDILIVDEVLAVGDLEFQQKCIGKMGGVAKEGRTVLFVSHSLAAIRQLCTETILLRQGRLEFAGGVEEGIAQYKRQIAQPGDSSSTGILFKDDSPIAEEELYRITRLEVLSEDGELCSRVSTWDFIRLRVHYFARDPVENGSGVITVSSLENVQLLLMSSRPDRGTPLAIKQGHHFFDCSIPRWPLAAGKYQLEAGLAVPMRDWLCRMKLPAVISTEEKDVYGSGFPPNSNRYQVAIDYEFSS